MQVIQIDRLNSDAFERAFARSENVLGGKIKTVG